jgi:hypothetical protein
MEKNHQIRKKNDICKHVYCNHSQPFTSYANLFDSHLTWYVSHFWGKNVNFLKINNCWKLEKLSKSDKYTIVICKQVYCNHLQRFHHISSCLTLIQSVIWEILGQKREIRKKKNSWKLNKLPHRPDIKCHWHINTCIVIKPHVKLFDSHTILYLRHCLVKTWIS